MGLSDSEFKNFDLVKEAIKRAADEGIYTIVVGTKVGGGYSLGGAGRNPLVDPNDLIPIQEDISGEMLVIQYLNIKY